MMSAAKSAQAIAANEQDNDLQSAGSRVGECDEARNPADAVDQASNSGDLVNDSDRDIENNSDESDPDESDSDESDSDDSGVCSDSSSSSNQDVREKVCVVTQPTLKRDMDLYNSICFEERAPENRVKNLLFRDQEFDTDSFAIVAGVQLFHVLALQVVRSKRSKRLIWLHSKQEFENCPLLSIRIGKRKDEKYVVYEFKVQDKATNKEAVDSRRLNCTRNGNRSWYSYSIEELAQFGGLDASLCLDVRRGKSGPLSNKSIQSQLKDILGRRGEQGATSHLTTLPESTCTKIRGLLKETFFGKAQEIAANMEYIANELKEAGMDVKFKYSTLREIESFHLTWAKYRHTKQKVSEPFNEQRAREELYRENMPLHGARHDAQFLTSISVRFNSYDNEKLLPIFATDGAHMYKDSDFAQGILLSMYGYSSNHEACGIGFLLTLGNENHDNWKYFLAHMQPAFQPRFGASAVVFGDGDKGLRSAFESLPTNNVHLFLCSRHVADNVQGNVKKLFEKCVKATSTKSYERRFKSLKQALRHNKKKKKNEKEKKKKKPLYEDILECPQMYFPMKLLAQHKVSTLGYSTSQLVESMNRANNVPRDLKLPQAFVAMIYLHAQRYNKQRARAFTEPTGSLPSLTPYAQQKILSRKTLIDLLQDQKRNNKPSYVLSETPKLVQDDAYTTVEYSLTIELPLKKIDPRLLQGPQHPERLFKFTGKNLSVKLKGMRRDSVTEFLSQYQERAEQFNTLESVTCSCSVGEFEEFPCWHSTLLAQHLSLNLATIVTSDKYHITRWREQFIRSNIYPIQVLSFPGTNGNKKCYHPVAPMSRGRPRMGCRIKGPGEVRLMRCSKCNGLGHNARSCIQCNGCKKYSKPPCVTCTAEQNAVAGVPESATVEQGAVTNVPDSATVEQGAVTRTKRVRFSNVVTDGEARREAQDKLPTKATVARRSTRLRRKFDTLGVANDENQHMSANKRR